MIDFFDFCNRGVRLSGARQRAERERREQLESACERSRAKWLNALLVDQTRAWMELGQQQHEVLSGLSVVLTLAALCKSKDGSESAPEVRVIRGAISAIDQCGRAGAVVTAAYAAALDSAVTTAQRVIREASHGAIGHAAETLNQHVSHGGAQ